MDWSAFQSSLKTEHYTEVMLGNHSCVLEASRKADLELQPSKMNIVTVQPNIFYFKIYDVPMKFASKLIHGGQCTFAIDCHTVCTDPTHKLGIV